MSGEKTAEDWLKKNEYPNPLIRSNGNMAIAYASDAMQAYADQQSAALKAALAELIPIAERHHKYFSSWLGWLDENRRDDETGEKPVWVDRLPIYKAAIDRAKKLLNKQPQSESNGDKNLS